MNTKDVFNLAFTGVLALCALVVTAIVVRREFRKPAQAESPAQPMFVSDWSRFAVGSEWFGDLRAEDTAIVFSDFQCPYCKQFAATLHDLMDDRGISLAILHRNYPISDIHPHARKAAVAAECAAKARRFKEYHDYLFQHQDSLSLGNWTSIASEVGIEDTVSFGRCLVDPTVTAVLRADSSDAASLGIRGTPMVILNGWLYHGILSEDQVRLRLKAGSTP
jgi:protein-disulfide isomerase